AWITVLDHWALPAEEREEQQEQVKGVTQSIQYSPVEIRENEEITKPKADVEPSVEGVERTEISSEAIFLNEIHTGGCTLFGTVLGPRANEAHKNHYHYDMAARSNGNYCE
ncbi:MAG: extensin family protein, partial [Alphaproteobacteria bacterium]